MRVYVASSWRNEWQPTVVGRLCKAGYDVYDFRNPAEGDHGFHWSDIDPAWKNWTVAEFVSCLGHPTAVDGFKKDMEALKSADVVILVMPCGRSAHLELGYAVGAGKPTAILTEDAEPELMYRMADLVTDNLLEVLGWLYDRNAELKG